MSITELIPLLAQRDADYHLDSEQQTATIPSWRPASQPLAGSLVGYIACVTLRSLATAEEAVVWDVFGSIISRWPGSKSGTSPSQSLDEEREWIARYREETERSLVERQLLDLGMALATVRLEFVADIEAFAKAHRTRDVLYLLPDLPRLENLLKQKYIEPDTGFLPGRGLDVVVITTAKTIVNECRHLLQEVTYVTPDPFAAPIAEAVKGRAENVGAAEPNSDEEQREAGDYFEITRYGGQGQASLVCTNSDAVLATKSVKFTGYIANYGLLQQLMPATVSSLATCARAGKFVGVNEFFMPFSTVPVVNRCLTLDIFEKDVHQQQSLLQQASSRCARADSVQSIPIPEEAFIPATTCTGSFRRTGYGNRRGVLRG